MKIRKMIPFICAASLILSGCSEQSPAATSAKSEPSALAAASPKTTSAEAETTSPPYEPDIKTAFYARLDNDLITPDTEKITVSVECSDAEKVFIKTENIRLEKLENGEWREVALLPHCGNSNIAAATREQPLSFDIPLSAYAEPLELLGSYRLFVESESESCEVGFKVIEETPELTESDIKMSIDTESSVTEGFALKYEYVGDAAYAEYGFGCYYTLEKLENGEWRNVPFSENAAFIDLGYLIGTESRFNSTEVSLSDSFYAEPLTAGSYRVVKDVSGLTLYAEFELAENAEGGKEISGSFGTVPVRTAPSDISPSFGTVSHTTTPDIYPQNAYDVSELLTETAELIKYSECENDSALSMYFDLLETDEYYIADCGGEKYALFLCAFHGYGGKMTAVTGIDKKYDGDRLAVSVSKEIAETKISGCFPDISKAKCIIRLENDISSLTVDDKEYRKYDGGFIHAGGLWGVVDEELNIIVPIKYDIIRQLDADKADGLYYYMTTEKGMGLMDADFQTLLEPVYGEICYVSGDKIIVVKGPRDEINDLQTGIVDRNGNLTHEYIDGFVSGRFGGVHQAVFSRKKGNDCFEGVIDDDLNIVIEPIYKKIADFDISENDRFYVAENKNGEFAVIDSSGKQRTEFEKTSVYEVQTKYYETLRGAERKA